MTSLIYLAVGVSERELTNRLRPRPHLHEAMLEAIHRHGGINGYLKHIGVSAQDIEKLRVILLE